MKKPKVFVVMPFKEEFDDLWQIGFRETLEEMGFVCARADGICKPGFVMSQVYEEIIDADLIVADMTNSSPNVFYEVGFAHALGKPTLLVATDQTDLAPFDTAGYRHFLHKGKAVILRSILRENIPVLPDAIPREPPESHLVWEWPNESFSPPRLDWVSRAERTKGEQQIDKMGGGTFEKSPTGSLSLVLRNTLRNWNHKFEWSIVSIMHGTKEFGIGDAALAGLQVQCDAECQLSFFGEGSRLSEDGKRIYVHGWQARTKTLPKGTWRWELMSADVLAERTGSSAPLHGLSVYFRIRTAGTVRMRRIRIWRRAGVNQ